jgi:hypothetical protein
LLEGKVDVVVVEDSDAESGIALWDYKTAKKPSGGAELYAYSMQMQLYALLYQRCFGTRPRETVLYFMGELAAAGSCSQPIWAITTRCIRRAGAKGADAAHRRPNSAERAS